MNSRLVDYFFVAKWQKGLEQGGVLQPAIGGGRRRHLEQGDAKGARLAV